MGQAIADPINEIRARNANAKETAHYPSVAERARDFVGRSRRNCRIRVKEPKDITSRSARAGIHLSGPTCGRLQHAITQRRRIIGRCIGTGSIDNENFR